jgi:hypothetical protein
MLQTSKHGSITLPLTRILQAITPAKRFSQPRRRYYCESPGVGRRELIWLFTQTTDWKARYLLAALLSGASPAALRDAVTRDLGQDTIGQIVGTLEELAGLPDANVPLTKVHLRIFELAMRGVPYEAMRQNSLARFACDDGALLPLGMQVTSVAI